MDYYTADVIAYNDYYPYGMLLPGRHGEEASADYRYGFQGQEKDDEVKGKGNSVNYKYRMHDTRIGRFFAVDPLAPKYPHYTPYQFSGNKVIDHVELEGLEEGDPRMNTNGNSFPEGSTVSVGASGSNNSGLIGTNYNFNLDMQKSSWSHEFRFNFSTSVDFYGRKNDVNYLGLGNTTRAGIGFAKNLYTNENSEIGNPMKWGVFPAAQDLQSFAN